MASSFRLVLVHFSVSISFQFQRFLRFSRFINFCIVVVHFSVTTSFLFCGFCVAAVSSFVLFVVHFSVSTSFSFQRLLRLSGFIMSSFLHQWFLRPGGFLISALQLSIFRFQQVSGFSGFCVSAVSLCPNWWLSTPRFQPIFLFSI